MVLCPFTFLEKRRIPDADLSDPETEERIRPHKTRSHQRKCDAVKLTRSRKVVESSNVIKAAEKSDSSPSFPAFIKLRLLSLFGSGDDENLLKETLPVKETKNSAEKVRQQYQKLFEEVLREGIENYKRHKPVLEHSVSAPEVDEGFAVREFPQSSQPRSSILSLTCSVDDQLHSTTLPQHCTAECKPINNISVQQHLSTSPPSLSTSVLPFSSTSPLLPHEASTSSSNNDQEPRVLSDTEQFQEEKNSVLTECSTSVPNLDSKSTLQGEQLVESSVEPVKFTLGGCFSDSEGENWVHATTQAIKKVESQVERISAAQTCYLFQNSSAKTSLQECGSQANGNQREISIIHRNGTAQIINRNGKSLRGNDMHSVETFIESSTCSPGLLHRFASSCHGSSISSLSSDNGTCSKTDTDDLASFFDTDSELPKPEMANEDDDDVFDEKTSSDVVPEHRNGLCKESSNIKVVAKAKTQHSLTGIRDKALKDSVCKEKAWPKLHEVDVKTGSMQMTGLEDKELYKRFYHVFREGELRELIEKDVECLHVISSSYDHANWCVVAEKIQVWKI